MNEPPSFFRVASIREALGSFEELSPLGQEETPLSEALGRVLSQDVSAAEDLPHFDRAVMDGYAVRAADTYGCSESQPAYLTCRGSVTMGRVPAGTLSSAQALRISTGGMIPEGADAVVMWEHTRENGDLLEVFRPAAPGEHVARAGEDVRRGERILAAGHRLRAPDVGLLSALGYAVVPVRRRPLVALISTGDELVKPDESPGPGMVRNVNQYSLGALIARCGAHPLRLGIVRDHYEAILSKVGEGLDSADVVLISGGSSAGTRDLTRKVVEESGPPGLLHHGLAVRPGKPTVVGARGEQPIIGLPGHPVSAMVVFLVLVRPLLNRLQGMSEGEGILRIPARLGDNLTSQPGREDFYQVRLVREGGAFRAEPVFRKSGLVSAMVRGEGMVRVPSGSEGLEAGEEVEVELYL